MKGKTALGLGSRFDWYEGTFYSWDDWARHMAVVLGGSVSTHPGRNGYGECQAITRGDDEVCRVYGRSARIGEQHIVITGASCDEVVPVFRSLVPEHRVSRVDSAIDLLADFNRMDKRAVQFAESRRLKHRLMTDSDGGATRYLGAPTSEVRVRIYKKSEQLRQMYPERAAEVTDGVVRVEMQARPGKAATKAATALLEPDGLWGLSEWGTLFAEDMLGVQAERLPTHFRRPSSWVRSSHYLAIQYGPLIAAHIDEVGQEQAVKDVLELLGLS